MEFNYEMYPDGISEQLSFIDDDELVWDRGYYCETEEGVWYELYVKDKVKKLFPDLYEENANKKVVASPFRGFKGLLLDHYEESDQITFFDSENEKKWGYYHLTDIFLQFLK
jgi:hypothetical protein